MLAQRLRRLLAQILFPPLPAERLLRDCQTAQTSPPLLQRLAQDRSLERLPLLLGPLLSDHQDLLQKLAQDQSPERLFLLSGLQLLDHLPGPLPLLMLQELAQD